MATQLVLWLDGKLVAPWLEDAVVAVASEVVVAPEDVVGLDLRR